MAAVGRSLSVFLIDQTARQVHNRAVMKTKNLQYLIMLGHTCDDINQSALPALLPFLIAAYGFSYTKAATILLVANILSAAIQPLIGLIGDKKECPWLMAVGALLACSGTAVVGLAGTDLLIYVGAAVTGLGAALFHPEAGRLANLAAGKDKASGVAIFSVGGNIGFVLGPLFVAGAYLAFGLPGMALFLIPGIFSFIALLSQNKAFCALSDTAREQRAQQGGTDDVGGFVTCATSLSCKSIISSGLTTFIPLFFMSVLACTESFSSAMLSLYSIAAVVGTLVGGRLGDKWGYKRLLLITFIGLVPSIAVFALSRSVPAAIALMFLISFASSLSFSSGTVLGQQFMPQHLGTASGIIFGLTVSLGGIASPFLGMAGDAWGVPAALYICAVIGLIGIVLTTFIPKQNRNTAQSNRSRSTIQNR